ncbi:MAG: triphosphoribosyl-dephospho-CoA synthase [Methylophilaceae bacterium]
MRVDSDISTTLASAFKSACLAELEALKPGNVHIFADGHGMVVQDFIDSAEAAAAVIALPDLTVGERILAAVDATWNAVGCNTNLGIILLSAPLIQAITISTGQALTFQERLQYVLQNLTQEDAAKAYQAIVRASPAGLGQSEHYDVHVLPQVTLLAAMTEAGQRDRIAWQYTHGFADVFTLGAARYRELLARWERPAWAASAVYLGFLARFPDTHIIRKYGAAIAQQVQQEAQVHEQALMALDNPKTYQRELLNFDADLKLRGLNPGTSADLTVASLLAKSLENILLTL